MNWRKQKEQRESGVGRKLKEEPTHKLQWRAKRQKYPQTLLKRH